MSVGFKSAVCIVASSGGIAYCKYVLLSLFILSSIMETGSCNNGTSRKKKMHIVKLKTEVITDHYAHKDFYKSLTIVL